MPTQSQGTTVPVPGLTWQANGQERWRFQTDAADDLCILAYGADGRYLRAPFCVARDSGNITFDGLATFSSRAAPVRGGAAGLTVSAHNVGENGGIGLLAQYFSGANGPGFDVGGEFVATFNPTKWLTGSGGRPGPGDMAQWVVALSPNDNGHNWGTNVVEFNVVNRGPDMGWHRDRAFQPVTGGLVVVPETSVFGDPGGGEGKNATYAYTASRSASPNSTGFPAKFYNDFLCEPNSEAGGTGRCLYATGDISGSAEQVPYGPFQIDGAWSHGIDTTKAKFNDAMAVRMEAGQALGFLWEPGGAAAKISGNTTGTGEDLVLQPAGSGKVQIKGDLAAAGLSVTGHLNLGGGKSPTTSTGQIIVGSSDTRGAVTLTAGLVSATVTFATGFASTPFCILTGNRTEDAKAITSVSRTAMSISLSANKTGETVYWVCMQ